MFDPEFRRSMMENALGELIKELEKCVPEDVKEDLHKMAACQARITARIRRNKALSSEDVKLYNDMCYKHFAQQQDGGEFVKEEPAPEHQTTEKRPGGIPTVCDEKAKDLVHNYILDHLDKSDPEIPSFDVYIVWKAKVLQNWKWLLASTLPDGMYYELTYNGDKEEYYLVAYRKVENKVIRGGALA